ncbi:MAG: hypothetical protein ACP5KV_00970 [Candidatus Methanomethylicaceae archaeon]
MTSSPCYRMGLPPELGLQGVGSVAEVPAFARGFTHIGHICRFGAGHLASWLAEAFPPRLLPHSLGLTVSTFSGDLYPRDYPISEDRSSIFKFIAIHPHPYGWGLLAR